MRIKNLRIKVQIVLLLFMILISLTNYFIFGPKIYGEKITEKDDPIEDYEPKLSDMKLWDYRRTIAFSKSTPEDDYQVKVQLNSTNFNYSRTKPDGADLRFYDRYQNNLSHWIETWNTMGKSIIWVKVPNTGTSTITMYYGNPSANSVSNGTNTFIFFDDFEGTSLDSKWSNETGSGTGVTVSGGYVRVYSNQPSPFVQFCEVGFHDLTGTQGVPFSGHYTNGHASDKLDEDNSWFTWEIRIINDTYAPYYKNDIYDSADTSTRTGSLPVEFLSHAAITGPGSPYWASIYSNDGTLGIPGRRVRLLGWCDLTTAADFRAEWVAVLKCNETEIMTDIGLEDEHIKKWLYCDQISINPDTPEDNYQVKVKLNSTNFNYSRTKAQGADIRFYDQYQNNLNYWIESWNTTGQSIVWVKILNAGTSSMTIYYGNPSANSLSNGTNTFIFFDDFEGTSVDTSKWDIVIGPSYCSLDVSNRLLTVTIDPPVNLGGYAHVGFHDTEMVQGVPFSEYVTDGRAKARITDNGGWLVGDVRWMNDTYAPYYENDTYISTDSSTRTVSLPVELYCLAVYSGPGSPWGVWIRTKDTTLGVAERTMRYKGRIDHDTDKTIFKVEWVVVYKYDNETESITRYGGPLKIITPENKTYYTLNRGHYPGTYSFENEPNGYVTPTDWILWQLSGSQRELYAEIDGHKKVYGIYDPDALERRTRQIFTAGGQSTGTIEFYIRTDDVTEQSSYSFYDVFTGDYEWPFYIGFDGSQIVVNNNSVNILASALDDTWYHIRIDFRMTGASSYLGLSDNSFRIYIDSVDKGTFNNRGSYDVLQEMHMLSGIPAADHYTYIDALGYSWDSNYDIGDNLGDDLMFNFNNYTNLDWIGYSLDGQTNITIYGNTTIPVPQDGSHTIQLFANNSLGTNFESNLLYFTVLPWDYDKPDIINLAYDLTIYQGVESNFSWRILENNTDHYEIYRNGTLVTSLTYQNDTDIIYSFTNWTVGDLLFKIVAYDTFGNNRSIEFIITILSTSTEPSSGGGGGGGGGGSTTPSSEFDATWVIIILTIAGVASVSAVVLRKKMIQGPKIPSEDKLLKARDKELATLEKQKIQQEFEVDLKKIDGLIKEERFKTAKDEANNIILRAKTLKLKIVIKRAQDRLTLINSLELQMLRSNLENRLLEAEKLTNEYNFAQATKILNEITKEANIPELIEIQNRAIQLNLRCQQIRRDLSKINTIKKTIIELGRRVNRLQIVEIGEASNINENELIIDVVKEMINKNEIDATYFNSTKSVAFNIQPVGEEIDKLLKTFEDLEKQGEGKK
jgi:hypothetical protein